MKLEQVTMLKPIVIPGNPGPVHRLHEAQKFRLERLDNGDVLAKHPAIKKAVIVGQANISYMVESVSPEQDAEYRCEECDKNFKNAAGLSGHMQAKHGRAGSDSDPVRGTA